MEKFSLSTEDDEGEKAKKKARQIDGRRKILSKLKGGCGAGDNERAP